MKVITVVKVAKVIKYAPNKYPCSSQIIFEGIRGGGYTSDAAIDDITIHKNPCPPKGTCDFERGTCGYTNLVDDQFDWLRHAGSTPSVKTGPKIDHTLGSSLGKQRTVFSLLLIYHLSVSFRSVILAWQDVNGHSNLDRQTEPWFFLILRLSPID